MTATAATAFTRGGTPWTPQYVEMIDAKKCIGCGRCYKVCPRDVLTLEDRGDDEVDDDWDDEDAKAMMVVKNAMDCIGCGACGRTCPKECFSFVAA
jgi:Nif-specific ferredoxin III